MGGRGSGSGFRAYERRIGRLEDSIRGDRVETAIVVDTNGNEIGRQSDGKKHEVNLSPELLAKLRDAVITHNHPNGGNFSVEDIATAQFYGARELRATTRENGTYVLRRVYELGHEPPGYEGFAHAARDAQNEVTLRVQMRIDRGELDYPREAYREFGRLMGEWFKKYAGRYGWEYRKER